MITTATNNEEVEDPIGPDDDRRTTSQQSLRCRQSNDKEEEKVVIQVRSRTFFERQPYIFAYGAVISLFSPATTLYQLCRLYKIRLSPFRMLTMSFMIFPHQTILKSIQMNASSPVNDALNPWLAFAVVGIFQGGVYGQANVHFSRALKLGKIVSFNGIFRGSIFATMRNTLSLGFPYTCSDKFRTNILDKIWITENNVRDGNNDNAVAVANETKRWVSVVTTSIMATYMSQGFHNFQIAMQSDQSLGYVEAVKTVTAKHGIMTCIRGAEARVGLLMIVNILNELLIKPAWTPVPVAKE